MRTVYRALYRLGITPWETAEIPAPLADVVRGPAPLPPGAAVDLGCGTGCQAAYLAAHGWRVTGVDTAPEALAAARRQHSPRPDGAGSIQWRLADVSAPHAVDPDGRLTGAATLLLDNGCLHGIPDGRRPGWAATAHHLAAPGCLLLVRAVTRHGRNGRRGRRGIGPIGITPDELSALLGPAWAPTPAPGAGWHRFVRR